MLEKVKEFCQNKPWLVGLLVAVPVVILLYFRSKNQSNSETEYQGAGMIYQPPSSGGSSGPVTSEGDSGIPAMMTSFLDSMTAKEEAETEQMSAFLEAQAKSQESFMGSISDYLSNFSPEPEIITTTKTVNLPSSMPNIPSTNTRDIFFEPEKAFSIPKGVVNLNDMPGGSDDEKWSQFNQTMASDYLGNLAKEGKSRVTDYQAEWGSAKTEAEKTTAHQRAMQERQNIYQEITRGGGGFSASWLNNGQELQVKTASGEVIKI